MSSEHRLPSTPAVTGNNPADLLIALVYGRPDADGNLDVSEEEIKEAEEMAKQPLPPEYQAACESITPDRVRSLIQAKET